MTIDETIAQLAPVSGKTAVVSLLSVANHAIDIPVVSGKRAIIAIGGFSLNTRTGSSVTGSLVFSIGNNSSTFDNMVASTTVAAAAFNAVTFSLPFFLPLTISASTGGMPDMATAPTLRITTALGGATTLTGRLGLQCLYV